MDLLDNKCSSIAQARPAKRFGWLRCCRLDSLHLQEIESVSLDNMTLVSSDLVGNAPTTQFIVKLNIVTPLRHQFY